jgi:hypothetical protein
MRDTEVLPLTVFDCTGIPAARRERIEAAVIAAGQNVSGPYEAWISTDPRRGGMRVLITGPEGFERTVEFDLDDDPAVIKDRVRQTLEDWRNALTESGCRSMYTSGLPEIAIVNADNAA